MTRRSNTCASPSPGVARLFVLVLALHLSRLILTTLRDPAVHTLITPTLQLLINPAAACHPLSSCSLPLPPLFIRFGCLQRAQWAIVVVVDPHSTWSTTLRSWETHLPLPLMFVFKKKKKEPQSSGTDAAINNSSISDSPVQVVASVVNNSTQLQSTKDATVHAVPAVVHSLPDVGQHSPMFLANELYRSATVNYNAQPQPTIFHQSSPSTTSLPLSGPVTVGTIGRSPGTVPGNPQLIHNAPMTKPPIQKPDSTGRLVDPRSPHAVVTNNYYPDLYPPSAPSLDLLHNPVTTNVSTYSPVSGTLDVPTSSYYQGSPSLAAYHPPPPASAPTAPPPQPMSYPLPGASSAWPQPQRSYTVTSTGQHYTPRPYVAPGELQTFPLVMAIDWGTTYSSMAYACKLDGEVHEVSQW